MGRLTGRGHANDDRGDTLIELLLATAIMSITVAAIFGAMLTATKSSVSSRSVVNNGTLVKSFIEQAEYTIQLASSPVYSDCATPSTYSNAALGYAVPAAYAGYAVTVTDVKYWNATTNTFSLDYSGGGSTTCQSSPSPDYKNGIQEIIAVATTPGGGSAKISSIVRNPTYKGCYATSSC
jgi:type II secretory pathway pseudopilin PulG